jgi:hypothetical protein
MPLSKLKLRELTEHQLLDRIVEESSEVISAACKFKRFGPDGYNPFLPEEDRKYNTESLGTEFCQLQALMIELMSRSGFDDFSYFEDLNEQDAAKQEAAYKQLGISTTR